MARPPMRFTCRWPPAHRRATRLATSCEFVRILVRLRTKPSPLSSTDFMPKSHMSTSTKSTSSFRSISSTTGKLHEVAVLGCSCAKNRPLLRCNSYISKQKFMCARPAASSSSTTFGSRLGELSACNLENGVHGGDPTSMKGLLTVTIFLTLFCTSFLLRSHGEFVSGSRMVRSKLHPAVKSVPPYFLMAASCAIRGCEYSSTTSAPFF